MKDAKVETLDWVSVLNEEASWRTRAEATQWLRQHLGEGELAEGEEQFEMEEFEKALIYMRRQFEALHFGEKPDTDWLNERLYGMTFKVEAGWEAGDLLPPFRSAFGDFGQAGHFGKQARGDQSGKRTSLRALTETLLLQFAFFLSQALRGNAPILRCEGLYRLDSGEKGEGLSLVRSISDSAERRWRSELSVISEKQLEDERDIQRCTDIVIPSRKAKYCSDACRFATFLIVKQLQDPTYVAEKQRRYRSRRDGGSSR